MSLLTGTATAFSWTETYSVNIATLDRQHQDLFATINELNRALSEGHGAGAVGDVLRQLLEYSRKHFAAEEVLMETHHFPRLPTHRLEHQAFELKIAKYMDDYREAKLGTPASLMLYLQSWLKEHLLKTDKAYSAFLNERGVF
jgi:hemerythrin-like metal-binding protein